MKSPKLASLKRSITVKIQENTYEIKFPNMGQIIDIESNKTLFSHGQYADMVKGGIVSNNLALDLLDAAATFLVLIPDIKKNLRIDSIFELEVHSAMELVKVYKKVFVPWYSEWIVALRELEKEEDQEEIKKDETGNLSDSSKSQG